jgi:hypothetical protein
MPGTATTAAIKARSNALIRTLFLFMLLDLLELRHAHPDAAHSLVGLSTYKSIFVTSITGFPLTNPDEEQEQKWGG